MPSGSKSWRPCLDTSDLRGNAGFAALCRSTNATSKNYPGERQGVDGGLEVLQSELSEIVCTDVITGQLSPRPVLKSHEDESNVMLAPLRERVEITTRFCPLQQGRCVSSRLIKHQASAFARCAAGLF